MVAIQNGIKTSLIKATPQVFGRISHAASGRKISIQPNNRAEITLTSIPRRDYSFDTRKISTERSALSYIIAAIVASSIFVWLSSWVKTPSTIMGLVSTEKLAEQLAIEQKQGAIWECIGREPCPYGGYVYLYKIRTELAGISEDDFINKRSGSIDRIIALTKKENEIYPAVEPYFTTNIQSILNGSFQEEFKKIGYAFDSKSGILRLPDEVALKAGFEKIRESHPHLKPLKICPSEGSADDLSFIKAYLEYDVLLSTSKEFVHDHTAHLMPTLSLLLSSPVYEQEREVAREIISSILLKIETVERQSLFKKELPKITTLLANGVDTIWSQGDIDLPSDLSDWKDLIFDEIEDDAEFEILWEKTHHERLNVAKLKKMWKQFHAAN